MNLPIVYNPDHVAPLPADHRFPMGKFAALYDVLIRDGIAGVDQFHCAQPAAPDLIALAHDPAYIQAYLQGTLDTRAMRRIGFPWSAALTRRTCTALGSSVLTAELALEHGLACSTAGGTHHAFYDFGSGFCIFNDLAVAARAMVQGGRARRVLIVDLDVHQGDGTAAILADDLAIFTFSLHCGANFPFRKQASDLDVDLPVGMEDEAYLATLAAHLPDALSAFKPDLVLYDAGVDPHRDDLLGKLALTDAGIFRRDRYVIDTCLGAGAGVACVIGGGYAVDIAELARRHSLVHRAAAEVWAARGL